MKVLVTGGAGYIGSHTCKALAAAGHSPIVYDNLSGGHRWAVRWGPLEEGDVGDMARLAEVMATHRPDAVIHFAALISVGESVQQPEAYYRVNLGGVLNVLQAMRAAGVGRFVFSSTATVHGDPPALPITEDMPYAPISPYSRSKAMVEQILADSAASSDLASVALRYFNACGADPGGELGEAHHPETHLIPLVLEAIRDDQPLTLNGTDYDTADGTCVRDYIHVTDLARAHVLALDRLQPGFRAYNLGTGEGYSVRQIIDAARTVTNKDLKIIIGPRRPGDSPAQWANPARAAAELGFKAESSSLESIISTAWAWTTKPPAYATA